MVRSAEVQMGDAGIGPAAFRMWTERSTTELIAQNLDGVCTHIFSMYEHLAICLFFYELLYN